MNMEDLLLIGGLLMAMAIFSGTHAHAQPAAPTAVTASAIALR